MPEKSENVTHKDGHFSIFRDTNGRDAAYLCYGEFGIGSARRNDRGLYTADIDSEFNAATRTDFRVIGQHFTTLEAAIAAMWSFRDEYTPSASLELAVKEPENNVHPFPLK